MRYVSWLSAEVSVLLYVSVEIISNEYNIIQQQQHQQQPQPQQQQQQRRSSRS